MNKIFIKLFILIFVLLSFPFPTFAISNTYELEELGLKVSIPAGYDVITQNTSVSSTIFNRLGTSGSELISQFKNDNIYLNAIPIDSVNEEIVVTMTTNLIDNFTLFSDTSLNTMASSWINEYEKSGIDVSK